MPTDVAYLLAYRSLDALVHPESRVAADSAESSMEHTVRVMVQQDNQSYMTQLQQDAQNQSRLHALIQQHASAAAVKFNEDNLPPPDSDMS
jgi:hypothetical protein